MVEHSSLNVFSSNAVHHIIHLNNFCLTKPHMTLFPSNLNFAQNFLLEQKPFEQELNRAIWDYFQISPSNSNSSYDTDPTTIHGKG